MLIADEASLFDAADYRAGHHHAGSERPRRMHAVLRALGALSPSVSRKVSPRQNFADLRARLERIASDQARRPRVLVVGGAVQGIGSEALLASGTIDFCETDVVIGPRTQLVCDAHNLPFRDRAFDAVICQAVLEHVVDPPRVVSEVHRVLRPAGYVYSETPFMQQVHMGAYDFTRYTMTGHRRLFRHFTELKCGAQCGPGMALAWAITYFVFSFLGSDRLQRGIARRLVALFTFWLPYIDEWLVRRAAAEDAASATYFMGQRSETTASDREIVARYSGGFPTPSKLTQRSDPDLRA